MSEAQDTRALPAPIEAEEVAVAVPVAAPAELASRRGSARPAVQAAAAAAGGFVAGAAVVGLVSRRRSGAGLAKGRPHRSLRRGRGQAAPELLQVVGTRTLLLDVHLLGAPTTER